MKSSTVVVAHPRMLPFAPCFAAQILILQLYTCGMERTACSGKNRSDHSAAHCCAATTERILISRSIIWSTATTSARIFNLALDSHWYGVFLDSLVLLPGLEKNFGTRRPCNHTLNCFCWLPPARHGASCSALHATGSNFGTSCGWHAHPPLHRTLAPSLRKAANVQCCSRQVLNPDDAFAFEPCVVENA
jgi:hypothetical protein